jgi:alkane 1-monooxygenase
MPTSAPTAETPAWRDGKYFMWAASLAVPLVPCVTYGIVLDTGYDFFWWLTPGLVFVLIPFLDQIIGDDGGNPPAALMQPLQDHFWYRFLVWAYVFMQYVCLLVCCYAWAYTELSWLGKLGLIASLGSVNGIGINTAHELGHKNNGWEQLLSKLSLAPTMYGHFFVEHNRGHHANVATPEDPASSRLGESFYAFWPRTVLGSVRSGWQLESERLRKRGLSVWSWRNEVLQGWAITVGLFAGLAAIFGVGVLPMLVVAGVFGFTLLELVNYLEHYGLKRERNAAGRYVKVEPRHSWNSNRIATNLFLYQLQRHSDHHANPTLRYQVLRHFDSAPQLPAGYATMIVLALVPPLWFKVMDPRVVQHYDGDLTLANIDPAAQARILAVYAP